MNSCESDVNAWTRKESDAHGLYSMKHPDSKEIAVTLPMYIAIQILSFGLERGPPTCACNDPGSAPIIPIC